MLQLWCLQNTPGAASVGCILNPDFQTLTPKVWVPQNHLDAESVSWLQNTLAAFPGTVVAVTHDRYFLDSVAGWILELDQGKGAPPRRATGGLGFRGKGEYVALPPVAILVSGM